MKKFIQTFFLSIVLSACMHQRSFANDINFRLDGVSIFTKTPPLNINGFLLLDIEDIAEILDLELESESFMTKYLIKGPNKLKIQSSNKEMYLNFTLKYLKLAPQIVDDKFMLPLRSIADVFGYTLNWIDINKTVHISSGNKKIKTYNNLSIATKDSLLIDYTDGLRRIFTKNSSSIKNLEDNEKLLYEKLKDSKDLEEKYKFDGDGNEANLEQTKRVIHSLDNQILNIPEDINLLKESMENEYKKTVVNIFTTFLDIQALENAIQTSKINLNNTRLKYSMGYETEYNMNKIREQLEKDESQLQILKSNLKNSREILNTLIDYPVNKDIVIKYTPEFKPLNININSYVATKINGNHKINKLQQKIDEFKYIKRTSHADFKESDIKLDNDISKAERDLEDAKEALDKAIRNLYSELKVSEDRIMSLELEKQVAENNYFQNVSKLEAGLITELDLKKSEDALTKSEIDLTKLLYTYDFSRFTFDRPYLLIN